MDAAAVDQIRLNFNPQGMFVINAAIGLMMFGVALDLKLDDFKRIIVSPKAPGIVCSLNLYCCRHLPFCSFWRFGPSLPLRLA